MRVSGQFQVLVPELEQVADVWRVACQEAFEHVSVKVVECPDLREWGLAGQGLCGNVEIVDVGGPLNVELASRRNLEYSIDEMAELLGRSKALFWGAGAATAKVVGVNAELMPNTHLGEKSICSYYSKIASEGRPLPYETHPYPSNLFANLGNFGVSDGLSGPVVCVDVRVRRTARNFVDLLAQALAAAFPAHQVSVAGVFRILAGSVRAHVMPDFPSCDLDTKDKVDAWLRFFEMSAPLTCLSVFHSADIHKANLRMQHTHFFSDDDRGGHYHYDTTPQEVHYQGYFVLASKVTKMD